ncbi:ABC transporter permease [Streptomyces roseirectus]|uniref:Transport permease protein n=1 Tax=Streptomyces roseirectus TaxID=2768066 RepID=A0A7H0IE55_9ACTN|nr:ABC transporter permease [Streptomyces roseirectus]QNP71071.1 ABC transporter permease [Streptomyces roseirectus]
MSTLAAAVTSRVHIVRYAARTSAADFRQTYTWRSWTIGWLGRMLSQVTFFALIGVMLGSPERTRYLVVGNAVMACVIETMTVTTNGVRERQEGTFPLLSASPAPLGTVLFGRGLQQPVSGAVTALVTLFALAPAFGVRPTWPQVPALILLVLVTALTSYGVGLFLSAVVIGLPGARNVVSNTAYLLMMAICGVQVPTDFWPPWVQYTADLLPLTHSLTAIRAILTDHPLTRPLTLALLTGALWLYLASLAIRLVQARGRRTGSFDYGA